MFKQTHAHQRIDNLNTGFVTFMEDERFSLDEDSTTIPNEFCCPITRSLMKDPVLMRDGQTYEREAIAAFLARNPTSPMTRAPISMSDALPNRALKDAIDRFASKSFGILAEWSFQGRAREDWIETCFNDTVENLKTKISALTHVPQQFLKLKFGADVLEDDEATVADLSIGPNVRIEVEYPLVQIFVKGFSGTTDIFGVFPFETVMNLKQKIAGRRGVPPDEQLLVYRGKSLSDDTAMLWKYGIQRDGTVYMNGRLNGGLKKEQRAKIERNQISIHQN
jgi:hypothetical protein